MNRHRTSRYIYGKSRPASRRFSKAILLVFAAVVIIAALSSCSLVTDVHKVHRGLNLDEASTQDVTGADHQIIYVPVKQIKF